MANLPNEDVCYICKGAQEFRPFCSRCGGTGKNVIATEPDEQSRPPDRFRKVDTPKPMLDCRMCGAPAELWQRWEKEDIWYSFGCCSTLEDVDGEPCHFHLPDSVAFYHPRKADAVRYWNLIMGPREAQTALKDAT